MNETDAVRHLTSAVVKTSPPVATAIASLVGVPLQSWVYIAAIAYTVLQSAYLAWKWTREWRDRRSVRP